MKDTGNTTITLVCICNSFCGLKRGYRDSYTALCETASNVRSQNECRKVISITILLVKATHVFSKVSICNLKMSPLSFLMRKTLLKR